MCSNSGRHKRILERQVVTKLDIVADEIHILMIKCPYIGIQFKIYSLTYRIIKLFVNASINVYTFSLATIKIETSVQYCMSNFKHR